MRFLFLGLLIVFISCNSSKNTLTPKERENFKNTIQNKSIVITANTAIPSGLISNVRGIQNLFPAGSSAASINLLGTSNYFKINKDVLDIDLPYYGQQQMSRGNNTDDVGIKFKGEPESINKKFISKKNSYQIRYFLKSKYDSYTVLLTLYANKTSNIMITSSHRSAISYRGNWKERKKDNL